MKPDSTEPWMVIVNPTAGNGAVQRKWAGIAHQVLTSLPGGVMVQYTRYPGHAIELVVEAVINGYRRFIAVGGDGTNHEVTNGILMQTTVPASEILYTLLPLGTGNDWGRTYHIPKKIDLWLSMIHEGYHCFHDAAQIIYYKNDKPQMQYCINAGGLAYDAFVVQFSERNKHWVRNGFFYLFMLMRCLFSYRLVPAKVAFDEVIAEDYFYSINFGICKYSGGGMQITPHAIPNDGYLAVTLARRMSKISVLLNTYRFYNGTLDRHPKITIHQTKKITITAASQTPVGVEADGELLGETPVEITLIPDAIQVIVPKPAN